MQEATEGRRWKTLEWGLKSPLGKCIGSHYNYVTHRCSRSAQMKNLRRQEKFFKIS